MENSVIFPVGVEKLDMEIQSQVAKWAVLQEIYLVDTKITRDPLIAVPEALTLEHKCYTNFLWSEKNKPIFEKILCNFQLAAFSAKAPDKLIMKIEASFCTSYAFNRDKTAVVPDDSADDLYYFSDINPISNAWPYWREFVQSMSTRMGFPALTVPLLEIVPKKAATKEAKSPPAKKQSSRQKKVSA
jgi:hypothetical protein